MCMSVVYMYTTHRRAHRESVVEDVFKKETGDLGQDLKGLYFHLWGKK